jgi:hypothetical protein
MRRLWYLLREVVWTAVVAVVLAVSAVVLAVLGLSDVALAVGLAGITFSFLSVRS